MGHNEKQTWKDELKRKLKGKAKEDAIHLNSEQRKRQVEEGEKAIFTLKKHSEMYKVKLLMSLR